MVGDQADKRDYTLEVIHRQSAYFGSSKLLTFMKNGGMKLFRFADFIHRNRSFPQFCKVFRDAPVPLFRVFRDAPVPL